MSGAGEPQARPHLLLSGDADARPAGLERALTRAGFHVSEAAPRPGDPPPDAVLITLPTADTSRLTSLLAEPDAAPPRLVLFGTADRDAPAEAIALGAADALTAPVHVPELSARLLARIRERQAPTRTPYEARVRESLRALVEHARLPWQPEELALALVRRLARALELDRCAFVVTGQGEGQGVVLAELAGGAESRRLDPGEYPEIGEAVRTRRPMVVPDSSPSAGEGGSAPTVALPVIVEDGVPAVLLMRSRARGAAFAPLQLELAAAMAAATVCALEQGRAQDRGRALGTPPPSLDRRLQEEFERARRYALSFSLVLLDVDPSPGAGVSAEEVEHHRQEIGSRLRRELRLPDFVSRCGGGEVAILLPETGSDGARRSVIRLRERLAADPAGAGARARMSAGIAAFPHPAVAAPDDLFALVEAALERGRAQSGERIGMAE